MIKLRPNKTFLDHIGYQHKTLFMMIGISYSGKSTWIKEQGNFFVPAIVVSTDEYIKRLARSLGKTYLETWDDESYTEAYGYLLEMVSFAVKKEVNIYWDQTNLTIDSRKKKLDKIPEDWKKVAVFLRDPYGESIYKRHKKREHQAIPWKVIEEQREKLEIPTTAEGFDQIWQIANEGW